jgi:hypothetical protein
LLIVCGAYEGGNKRKSDWNKAIMPHIGKVDGVAIHTYVRGDEPQNEDEEDAYESINWSELDQWPVPIYITEAGHGMADLTEGGRKIYRDFHREMLDYLEERNDGSVAGSQVLTLKHAKFAAGHYGAVYFQGQPTFVHEELMSWPWREDTVEPPVEEPPVEEPTPEPPQEPEPTEPYVVSSTKQYMNARTAQEKITFSDGSTIVRLLQFKIGEKHIFAIEGQPKSLFETQ